MQIMKITVKEHGTKYESNSRVTKNKSSTQLLSEAFRALDKQKDKNPYVFSTK